MAGDIVIFRGGTYYGQLQPRNSGNQSNGWITFKAYPGEEPVIIHDTYWSRAVDINGVNFIAIDGLTAIAAGSNGPGIGINEAHHVKIINCTAKNSATSGIATTYGIDYLTIEGNHIFGNSERGQYKGSGISIWNSGGPIFDDAAEYHIIIRNNTIYDNRNLISNPSDGNGIIIDNNDRGGTPDQQSPKTLISNNVIFNNGGRCIHLLNSSNTDIINNTCYHNVETPFISDNCGGEISLQRTYAYSSAINLQVYNNIVYGKGGTCNDGKDQAYLFQVWCGQAGCPQYTADYNLWFNGAVVDLGPHDIVADPDFRYPSLNPTSADFRLMKTSPAIDSGTDQFAQAVTADYLGIPRPRGDGFDMGAFEYWFLNYYYLPFGSMVNGELEPVVKGGGWGAEKGVGLGGLAWLANFVEISD
jgi:parallel beta-helix repeat protein